MPVRFPLERSKLAELARSLRDDDPVWFDDAAAVAAGFAAPPLPPTATVLADHWREGGMLAAIAGMDFVPTLHGEASWEYLRPLRIGEEVTVESRVLETSEREGSRGGAMTLVVVETLFLDERGEVAVRRRDTLIGTRAKE